MTINIVATLILVWWALQGAKLTLMTWGGPYSPIWAIFQGLVTLLLIIPAIAIWL